MALVKCKTCGKDVDSFADHCPQCGACVWAQNPYSLVILIVFFGAVAVAMWKLGVFAAIEDAVNLVARGGK